MRLRLSVLFLFFAVVTIQSCTKQEKGTSAIDTLINEDGWFAYKHRRYQLGEDPDFKLDKPYVILNEYGDAVRFSHNEKCTIMYSALGDSSIVDITEMNYKLISTDSISFELINGDDLNVEIVELSNKLLWIKYDLGDHIYEYKLRNAQ